MIEAIYKRNRGELDNSGDAVCGNVPEMLEYISERVGMTPLEVQQTLEAGEIVSTCFAHYCRADRTGHKLASLPGDER